jgi:hypothetical protein
LSDGEIKFLREEQALVLQTINGLRDAAQHHLLDVSEGQLYVHIQSGVTLFRDLLKSVFGQELVTHLPNRVTCVDLSPTSLATLFDCEIEEIKKLLRPGRRRKVEAMARLRPLAILDATIQGEKAQPSDVDLKQISNGILTGKTWTDVFKGASAVEISADGVGPNLSLRLSKKEGVPIQLLAEGTPGASVVAVKRVNELDFFSLGAKQLAAKLSLSLPKTIAVVDYLGIRSRSECYKEFKIGSQLHKRYSEKTLGVIREALEKENADVIWAKRFL